MIYYAKIEQDEDGLWCAEFIDFAPDLIVAEGTTLEEALIQAHSILHEYLAYGLPQKPQQRQSEKGFYAIEVSPAMIASLNIRWQRHKLGLTQQEVATALGLQQPNYARLEKSGKMDLTMLDKIAKALKINKASLIEA
ncbi:helix-turn-helix domain-containing protein [Entomospira culicis]|uniref:Type II toxin-antitoxin system HicB family antitoxin n=1 Tax=Entomospira culicis TaxID=2719989 RepID=A0A968GH30_9SPIO|nr:helix-turn-helix domain-containing protein [Entomospira culicis]NIZ19986.1 type II toxin-antitoxin system HicB family antitoxin [Entomospira culicis]NIZ70212.1 type II toxin-antitoxin system HicB family antitoxin [Entomospira culicis]WDI38080.1 helix-turn-helix domain-containing protein [Entomospira culicis]WDI39703.1 helix-turn-helix domain-containing protein [Entomospira culicis]